MSLCKGAKIISWTGALQSQDLPFLSLLQPFAFSSFVLHTQPSPGSKERSQSSEPKMFARFDSTVNHKSQQTYSKAVYLSPFPKHDSSVDLIAHSGRSSFSSQRNATPPEHHCFQGRRCLLAPCALQNLTHTLLTPLKCSQAPLQRITAKVSVCFAKSTQDFCHAYRAQEAFGGYAASRELWQPCGAVFVSRRITKTVTKGNVILNRAHVSAEVGWEFSNTLLMVWLFTEMFLFLCLFPVCLPV